LPPEANVFYELYLQDSSGKLIDVPIVVENFKDEDGKYPNEGNEVGIKENWRLARRFLIYDTISGLRDENSFKDGIKPPSYVRWASSMTLKMTSDPKNAG